MDWIYVYSEPFFKKTTVNRPPKSETEKEKSLSVNIWCVCMCGICVYMCEIVGMCVCVCVCVLSVWMGMCAVCVVHVCSDDVTRTLHQHLDEIAISN